MSVSITIDPGHVEGYNTGYNKNYKEGTKMFTLAYYLKEELEKYDLFDVYVTRKTVKENPTLETRGRMAINNKSKVFLSLHSNAASSSATGSLIIKSVKRLNDANEALANKLLDAIVKVMKPECPKTYSRGTDIKWNSTKNADYYGVLRNSVTNSIVEYSYIVEHGFHTNPDECNWLVQDANLRKLAVAEAKALADHFGAKLKINEEKKEMEELKNKVELLEKEIAKLTVSYKTINDVPDWAKPSVQKLINKGALKGDDSGLNLSYDLTRTIVILDRTGAFGK